LFSSINYKRKPLDYSSGFLTFENNLKNEIMKKVLLLAIAIIFVSCSKDFSKVKVGMTVKEVTDLVGEPKEKQDNPLFGKWYVYDKNIVVFFNDTVTKSMTTEELKESMKEVNKGLEDLSKSLK